MSEKIFSYWNRELTGKPEPVMHGERNVAALIGWGGVQILDPGVDIVNLCFEYAVAVSNSSCGQCVPCRTGSRSLAAIFVRIREGKGRPSDLGKIRTLSETISSTSMCDIGKSSPGVFLYLLDRFDAEFRAALKEKKKRKKSGYEYKSVVTAPCMQACPIHLDIPRYIEEIKFGRFSESLEIIRQRLPLPGILGRVCVRPCESNCRRGLADEPLQIKHLKRFVADQAIEDAKACGSERHVENSFCGLSCGEGPQLAREPNGVKVAIVGAGPAGLTCAHFLALEGYEVTIFEMLPEPGGMAAVGIPDYRLPRDILRGEVAEIERLGVNIVYGKGLGTHFTLDDLDNEGYKAVFIGMGCHCHKSMGIEGEDKGYEGFVPGVYFLRNVNLGRLDEVPRGRKMVVVGGGNVAIDCVRIAFRIGFEESHIVYRRSRKEMPADAVEINDAETEGVQFHFLTAPRRILGDNGKVTGLECLRMELGEPDASGRRRPEEVPGSEFVIDADVVVAAIGQEGDFACFCNLPGVEVTERGAIVVDENLMTTRKGVFSGGDCVTGPDVLIRACAHGRLSALRIDRYIKYGELSAIEEKNDERLLAKLKVFDPREKVAVPDRTGRVPVKHELPLERRKDFREVDKGYTPEEAKAEAERCLRCYRVVMYVCKK